MTIGALYPPLSAFSAYGAGLNNTAHNLANLATNNFKAGRVTYSELPNQSGVKAQGPQQINTQGPLVPHGAGLPPLPAAPANVPNGFTIGSNTNIITEMVGLITSSQAYRANAKTVTTVDQLLGTIVNLKV